MKNTIKHIIVSILLVYFVISGISIGYYYTVARNQIEELQILKAEGNGTHEEMINLANNLTIEKLFKLNYFSGKMSILTSMFKIMIFSLVIGILVGLSISVKENSKIKYILFFILGNIAYNGIMTFIIKVVYERNNLSLGIGEAYCESFKRTIAIYVLFYMIFFGLKLLDNRSKVNKLNKELNNKNRG